MTVDSYRTRVAILQCFCEHAFCSKAKSTAETGLKCISIERLRYPGFGVRVRV